MNEICRLLKNINLLNLKNKKFQLSISPIARCPIPIILKKLI